METMGAEGQWTSLSGAYTAEEADFMASLLGNPVPSTMAMTLQNLWPFHGHQPCHDMPTNYGSLELSNPNNLCPNFSRGSTSPSTNYVHDGNSCSFNNAFSYQNSLPTSIDFFLMDMKTTNYTHNSFLVQRDDCLSSEEISHGGEAVAPKTVKESESNDGSGKRPRISRNVDVAGKKPAKPKKKPKLVLSIPGRRNVNEEEGKGFGASGRSPSSTCCSGDESINGGQESPGSSSLSPKEPSSLGSDGKARARRGSATDPQSLYARKRRERINERLKILQNLIPNGTKVDISTMLEEAVQYVKFLQIQIKLLSSDDLWMYAPIAYNGKELGLDHHLKLSLAKAQS